eukprot:s1332_g20.t3
MASVLVVTLPRSPHTNCLLALTLQYWERPVHDRDLEELRSLYSGETGVLQTLMQRSLLTGMRSCGTTTPPCRCARPGPDRDENVDGGRIGACWMTDVDDLEDPGD